MSIKDYSTTAASNTSLFPENMNPNAVNDGMRQVQADIREFYNDIEWRDLGDTPTFASATTFTLAGDLTSTYVVNRRIRCFGTTMGTLYGTIASSSFSSPNTTVTVTLDSGSLTSNLSAVSLGVDPTNTPIPFGAVVGAGTAAQKDTGTSGDTVPLLDGDNDFSGTTTLSGGSVLGGSIFATGSLLTSGTVAYSDDGELTIASGAIGVTGVYHTVDTESDAASDDLDTINNAISGRYIVLQAENTGRTVVIKHNTGNIYNPEGVDISLDDEYKTVTLIYSSALTRWVVISGNVVPQTRETYESPAQTITAAGSLTLTHGLSGEPNEIDLYLECATDNSGYTAGDRVLLSGVPIGSSSSASNQGVAVVADATEINIRYGSAGNTFQLLNFTNGTLFNITNSQWRLVIVAKYDG